MRPRKRIPSRNSVPSNLVWISKSAFYEQQRSFCPPAESLIIAARSRDDPFSPVCFSARRCVSLLPYLRDNDDGINWSRNFPRKPSLSDRGVSRWSEMLFSNRRERVERASLQPAEKLPSVQTEPICRVSS